MALISVFIEFMQFHTAHTCCSRARSIEGYIFCFIWYCTGLSNDRSSIVVCIIFAFCYLQSCLICDDTFLAIRNRENILRSVCPEILRRCSIILNGIRQNYKIITGCICYFKIVFSFYQVLSQRIHDNLIVHKPYAIYRTRLCCFFLRDRLRPVVEIYLC